VKRAYVVGLTGGIGSGKSAAADEFARLGASVVDADAISHELSGPGGAAVPAIKALFGDAAINRAGAMDRAKVRAMVFSDPAKRKALESLLHPMIRDESARRIESATAPYVVHVVPLLVESPGYRARVDRVLVVDAPEDVQVSRVRTRGIAEPEIRAIIASQAPRAVRLAAADDVVDNSGSLDALRQQVGACHRKYLEIAGKRQA
jgi:dephospho-CoA kinase